MPETIDPVDIEVGGRVRQLRVEAGMTQSQLGDKIGVTFQQVQKYERGTNRVSASMMVRIAEALNLPPNALFGKYGQNNGEDPVVTDPYLRDIVRRWPDIPLHARRVVRDVAQAFLV